MNTTDHTYNFAAWCTGAAVLVQRGSCPFATKAENAERAKAAAVLVINSDDGRLVFNECSHTKITVQSCGYETCFFHRLHVHGPQ